jgi:hypothetical protein
LFPHISFGTIDSPRKQNGEVVLEILSVDLSVRGFGPFRSCYTFTFIILNNMKNIN